MRTIALEEAFLHPAVWEVFPPELKKKYSVVKSLLDDVGPARIRRMDAAGIEMQVLSHVQPGLQLPIETGLSVRLAREVNDWLGGVVARYPTRFAGFATLPTQDPQAAADELERCVTRHAFVGALINGHTNGRYLDDDFFSVLLDRAQKLDVPIYIHPTDPPATVTETYYRGNDLLVTGWGWQVETGTHLLRMIIGGVFDRYPRLKIIVGHMGELIPFCLPRLNLALTLGNWLEAAQISKTAAQSPGEGMQKSLGFYLRENVYVTTSGVFDQPAFACALANLGIDHILFSVDDPFRDSFEAMDFLKATKLMDEDREKLAHGNAERVLRLPGAVDATLHVARARTRALKTSLASFRARAKSKIGRALLAWLVK